MTKFKTDHAESVQREAPETKRLRQDFEHWVGEANDLIRKILVSDQALMDQASHRIVAKVFTEQNHGKHSDVSKWGTRLSGLLLSLDDDQRASVVRLWEKKKVVRNRIVEALGGLREGETHAAMCMRVRHPFHTMKQTAAIMAHLGIYRANPGEPVQTKRRTLTEADHNQRAKEADEMARMMIP